MCYDKGIRNDKPFTAKIEKRVFATNDALRSSHSSLEARISKVTSEIRNKAYFRAQGS